MAKRIDVSGLSAYYTAHKAIDDISMTVEPRLIPTGSETDTRPE